MSTQRGKKLVMTGGFQDDFATPADSGLIQIPYYDESFDPGEDLEDDPEITPDVDNDRDMTAPAPSLANPTGNVTVAADINAALFWLKLLLGDPETTAAPAPFTHVFKSGAPTLPSATLELPLGEERWKSSIGVKANTWGFSFDKEAGYKRMQFGCVAREVRLPKGAGAALFDGLEPAVLPRAKAAGTKATLQIEGVTVARCIGGNFQYNNNLVREDYADGGEYPSDYAGGDSSVEITPRLRLARQAASNAVLDYFEGPNGPPFACSVTLQISATSSLVISLPKCKGRKISPVVGGPGPVEFQGRIVPHQTVDGPSMTVTVINSIESI